MRECFEDKVVLVTGAGSGMGRASAIAFAKQGAKVIVNDIDSINGEETCDIIAKKKCNSGVFIKADVSKISQVEKLFYDINRKYGGLDYAHNNVGLDMVPKDFLTVSEDEWDKMIDVNLKSVWLTMKYEIGEMLKKGKGAIVNTASVSAFTGGATISPYVAAKGGVLSLTRSAALAYAKKGIRINAIAPGSIYTSMSERIEKICPDYVERVSLKVPLGRIGHVDEVANTVVWLCSDYSSYIIGECISIDGGYRFPG